MQRATKQITFWRNVIGDEELIARHRARIDCLLQGQFQGQLERIRVDKNIYIYVARLNDANRLFSTTITIDDCHYLWVFKEVLNHDYQKEKHLLQGGGLKSYLEKHQHSLIAMVKKLQQAVDKKEESSETQPIVKLTPFLLDSDKDKLLVYNERQEAVWNRLLDEDFTGALLLLGAAGSGKTTIAVSVLKDLLHRFTPSEKIIFIAKSTRLVDLVRKKLIDYPQIECKTIDQLKRELKPALADFKEVGKDNFEGWMDKVHLPMLERQTKAKKDDDKKSRIAFLKKEIGKIYQEYRTISGIGREAHLAAGRRQSVFEEKEIRELIYDSYQSYLKYLPENKLYDPAFEEVELPSEPIYAFMVLDEGLDCSHKDFRQLNALTKSILVLGDPKQNLYDEVSNLTFFIDEMQKTKVFQIEYLLETCRCPANPAELINKWVMLRNAVMGGVLHELELSVMRVTVDTTKPKGDVVWYDGYKKPWIEASKRTQKETEYAVITYPEYVKEAENLFGEGLVYSIEDYKGLEDRAIVAYRLLDNEIFREVNAIAGTLSMDSYVPKTHKPKDWQEKIKFLLAFNLVFTLLSRTTERLYIFQKKYHYHQAITDYLDPSSVKLVPKPEAKPEPQVVTTTEDWQEKIDKLMETGYRDKAKTLYVFKLGKTEAEFDIKYPQPQTPSQPKPTPPKVEKTSPQLVAAKPTQPVKKDKYKYVLEIYEKFSEANLKLIIASPSCIQLMFGFAEKGIIAAPNLFTAIMLDERRRNIFFNFIKDKKNAADVAKFKEKLIVGMYQVQVIEDLTQNSQAKMMPFHWLGVIGGQATHFLVGLLKEFPELLNKLSSEILHQEIIIRPGETRFLLPGISYYLPGLEMIMQIYENHPEWLMTLPQEALFCLKESDASLFFALVTSTKGISLLSRIFDCHPEWIKDLKFETLSKKHIVYDGQMVSAFFYLTGSSQGFDLLLKIMLAHDEWFQNFPKELLFQRVRFSEGYEVSAFQYLMMYSKSITLLTRILRQNELIDSITKELFFHPFKLGNGAHIYSFYYLMRCREGVVLLFEIFKKHPEWFAGLPVSFLTDQVPLEQGISLPVLTCLVNFMFDEQQGRDFLLYIFDRNNRFYKLLPPDTLFKSFLLTDGRQVSLFTMLCYYQLPVLIGLLEQNDIITEEQLFAELFRKIDSSEDSVFRSLALQKNDAALKLIIKKYPNILSRIPKDILCKTIINSKGQQYYSPLFLLTCQNLEVFGTILDAQPNLLQEITLSHLCEKTIPVVNYPLINSLLIMWFESEEAKPLLEKWLLIHPDDKEKAEEHIREYQKKKAEMAAYEANRKVEDAQYNEALDLYNNLDEKNLSALLTNPKCILLLFGYSERSFNRHDTLFFGIMQDQQKRKIFIDFIKDKKNNEIVLKFKGFILSELLQVCILQRSFYSLSPKLTTLHYLVYYGETIDLVMDFFKAPVEISEDLLKYNLYEPLVRSVNGSFTTLFYILIGNGKEKGISLIEDIFRLYPNLFRILPVSVIYQMVKVNEDLYSIFYYLTDPALKNSGTRFLSTLFSRRPDLLNTLPHDVFFQPVKEPDGKLNSAFSRLAYYNKQFLAALLKNANNITEGNLMAELFRPIDRFQRTAFAYLAGEKNHLTLKVIFKKFPNMVSSLPLSSICKLIEEPNGRTYSSILALLSHADSDMEMVYALNAAQPDLLKQLTLTQLSYRVQPTPEAPTYVSLLHIWLGYKKGRALLKQWLKIHPEEKDKLDILIQEYKQKQKEIELSSLLFDFSIFNQDDRNKGEGEKPATLKV